MQSSLLEFFKTKKTVQPTSPNTKKATAIRSLKRVSKRNDEEFKLELSDELESDDDEKEFKKIVTKEKIMKGNKFKDESDYSDFEPEPEPEEKPANKRTKAPKPKKAATPAKQEPAMGISPSSSMEAIGPVSDICELPKWLTTDLRDAQGNKPDSPNYDPTTVLIPESAKNSFTPFQKQFWRIKEVNFDAIVMIRKGKFYEMFSVDAVFARDVLKLRLTNRGKEPMCGVPEKSFAEWALKIINSGKRVCKVEQMETAIDQKNRGSSGGEKTIERKLVQIYSSGTIDDFEMLESSQPSFLMGLRSSAKDSAGICLVDCSTGSFHMGVVNEDDLTDVLIRFEPVEVLFNKECLHPAHMDIVKAMCSGCATHAKSGIDWDPTLAMNQIQRRAGWDDLPECLTKFPEEAIAALGGCVAYLDDHKIAKSLLSLKRFSSLDEAGGSKFLSLDSSALTNLQIIGKDDHCLLNILDKWCTTPFGKRRLRYWVMHPLRDVSEINKRLDAVEELMDVSFANVSKRMQTLPDLERILSRVYANRCGVRVFLDCLESLEKAADLIGGLEGRVESSLLRETIARKGMSKEIKKHLEYFNKSLQKDKSLADNEFVVRKGVFPDIDDIDEEVKAVEEELEEELNRIRKKIGHRDIEYASMQTKRYEIEIPARIADELGSEFILMSQTKAIKRFRTPAVNSLVNKLENVENERQKRRSTCQQRFINKFASHSGLWDAVVDTLGQIDCLLSLAAVSQRWKDKCRPTFVSKDSPEANGRAYLSLTKMRHPCIVDRDCIPNDVLISDKYVLIITGPNASGKSTFARMCCVAIVLAQIGCFLPAEAATLTVYDQIFTRIGAGDRLFSGKSTFAVELAETARLMSHATCNSFVVLDELGRGTSTFDGIAIATGVLEHFIENIKCPLVFCTHYHVLTQQFQAFSMVRNVSMLYKVTDKRIRLMYQLVPGACPSSFGCEVAKVCGLPEALTKEAQEIAWDFESRHKALHVSSSECHVEVVEMVPEYRTIADQLRAGLSKGSNMERAAALGSVIERLRGMDLTC